MGLRLEEVEARVERMSENHKDLVAGLRKLIREHK
jgi:hypothetical protein